MQHSCSLNLFPKNYPKKTIIVFGVARGGTSMVAGVLRKLNIFMGHDLPNNHEDQEFIGAGINIMSNLIKKRNESHDVWGWKNPIAANHLDKLRSELRNPYLVVVYRDFVATTKGHTRWHGREEMFALSDIMQQQQKNSNLIFRWQVPSLLVSYEKAILNPENFITELSNFVFVDKSIINIPEIIEFMKPGKYKNI